MKAVSFSRTMLGIWTWVTTQRCATTRSPRRGTILTTQWSKRCRAAWCRTLMPTCCSTVAGPLASQRSADCDRTLFNCAVYFKKSVKNMHKQYCDVKVCFPFLRLFFFLKIIYYSLGWPHYVYNWKGFFVGFRKVVLPDLQGRVTSCVLGQD